MRALSVQTVSLVLAMIASTSQPALGLQEATEASVTEVGVERGGGGLFLRGEDFDVRLMGYIQPTGHLFPRSLERSDAPGAFSIRRARLDLLVELQDRYTLFVEIDGAPENRTALVEAWLNWRLAGEGLQLRAGKFIGRFSTENTRSSRDLATVERFMALNSMFLLPALDTQTGAMLHGAGLADGRIGYSLGVYNGNGSANTNAPENNSAKEIQAKVHGRPHPDLRLALAFDWSREEEQTLQLVDQAFNPYASVPVAGRRVGVGGDVRWERPGTSLRAEALAFSFRTPADAPGAEDAGEPRAELHGGYVEPSRFVAGGPGRGVQLVARGEWTRMNAEANRDTDTLYAFTLGMNAFPDPNLRVQLNAIATRSTGPSLPQRFDEARWMPMLLGQIQLKL